MALLTKERLQERLRLSRERHEKKRKAEKERREAIKREVLAELKKPKKIKLIKLDGYKDIAHRSVGKKTVGGRGFEPYEAVRYASTIFLGDIYETRDELMDAEKRGEGKINWDYFDSAVKRVRDLLK